MEGGNSIVKDIKNIKIAIFIIALYLFFSTMLLHTSCICVAITGFPCPGCGLTRAGKLMLSGRFKEAFLMNPSIFFWTILAAYFIVWRYVLKKETKYLITAITAVSVIMIVIYMLKMVYCFPNIDPLTYQRDSFLYKYVRPYREIIEKILMNKGGI